MIAFSAIVALGCEDGGVNGVPALPPSSISVEPTRLDLRTGETQSITVNVLDSSGNPIENPILTFSSSDAAVAAVDNRGVVTGVGEGTAAISVEAEGLIAVLLVNVQAIVGSVEIDPETMTRMSVNEAGYLTVTVLDQHGEEIPGAVVEWSSDNEDVATVERVLSPFGGNHCGCDAVVIAIAKGTATITAESRGVSATATVTIDRPGLLFETMEVVPAEATIPVGGMLQLTVMILNTDGVRIIYDRSSWWSEDDDVATVDENGLVTAVAKGRTTIYGGNGNPFADVPAAITVE